MSWLEQTRRVVGFGLLAFAAYFLYQLVMVAPPPSFASSHFARVCAAMGVAVCGHWMLNGRRWR